MAIRKRSAEYYIAQTDRSRLDVDTDADTAASLERIREAASQHYEGYRRYVANISRSGLSIYDVIEVGNPELWIPTPALTELLNDSLVDLSLDGLPLRTRSKVLKECICRALGYPVPKVFAKTQPRFPGQNFDTYIQKSDNLQIWNEEVNPTRRYVLIRLSANDVVLRVKVVTGEVLAKLDKTGTLTQKYQARLTPGTRRVELVTPEDTENLRPLLARVSPPQHFIQSPISWPSSGSLLPIAAVFKRLMGLVGRVFGDTGFDQERNRGAVLHQLVCAELGYDEYQDVGLFPDVPNQLLEVKLQTSPTIDLGLIHPDSQEPLGMSLVAGIIVRHCDVRYAIFGATTDGDTVTITHLLLTTGEAFFTRFQQFQGKVVNRKLQIPLPKGFFED